MKLIASMILALTATAGSAQMPGVDKRDVQNEVAQIQAAFVTPTGRTQSGSPAAARQAAAEFVSVFYSAPVKTVSTFVVDLNGDWATIRTAWNSKICILKLTKDTTANQFGWIVKEHPCQN